MLEKGPDWQRDEGSYFMGWLFVLIGLGDMALALLGVFEPLTVGEWVVVLALAVGGSYMVFRHRFRQ